MRYIVNANNYITAISFGCKIECQDDGCTEYTGSVPTGYTSLEDWYADEAERVVMLDELPQSSTGKTIMTTEPKRRLPTESRERRLTMTPTK